MSFRTAIEHYERDLVSTFVADLRAHLVGYYRQFGADIVTAGGNTLQQAQDAVSLDLVVELADILDDPYAHDLDTFRVLRHPDVVFPGSDISWFGAYHRATCVLSQIYDFN
ncbi:hypothetical protein SAMN02745121_00890 [Nannocystis exedens]|uniref:Uncharacterized protein n=1 Tax=Nannocystis exedens TaxID=54 RepID=A0A1I1U1Q3_9BACT|nr:hypothetical protein [Nannocystis exedens]PCC71351.1 hypothetical protein NAEX_04425 [Nannocystis exedens]SFD64644.1 hypothetical protein SAMN02745121_00890 [Nannocystis exedens]